jgi:hypothetical protein
MERVFYKEFFCPCLIGQNDFNLNLSGTQTRLLGINFTRGYTTDQSFNLVVNSEQLIENGNPLAFAVQGTTSPRSYTPIERPLAGGNQQIRLSIQATANANVRFGIWYIGESGLQY